MRRVLFTAHEVLTTGHRLLGCRLLVLQVVMVPTDLWVVAPPAELRGRSLAEHQLVVRPQEAA